MANIKCESKRALVSYLSRSPEATDLLSALEAEQDRIVVALKSGKILTASSGAGFSATFSIIGALAPDEMFGLSQELIEVYTDARAALVAAGAFLSGSTDYLHDDPLILARMMLDDRMNAVTRYQTDFTAIRIPQTMGGPL